MWPQYICCNYIHVRRLGLSSLVYTLLKQFESICLLSVQCIVPWHLVAVVGYCKTSLWAAPPENTTMQSTGRCRRWSYPCTTGYITAASQISDSHDASDGERTWRTSSKAETLWGKKGCGSLPAHICQYGGLSCLSWNQDHHTELVCGDAWSTS